MIIWQLRDNSKNFMYLAWIIVELCLVQDTRQRCSGAHQWRHVRIAFTHISLMSYKITRSQANETNAGVALTAGRFILSI